MKLVEHFLKYIAVNTQSNENSGTHPSFQGEFDLARLLADELKELGLEQVVLSEKCYVYGRLPATPGLEKFPALGFISHMDTSSSAPGKDVKARIVRYEGKPIELGHGKVLDPKVFHSLNKHVGKELIVTDGSTLLGGDDKAGIAEIIAVLEEIIEKGIPHGKICVAFTPDEEIGEGAKYFDLKQFGADFAYTLDGSSPDEIEYCNFNAASLKVTVHGIEIHPGYAKNVMKNAQKIGFEFNAMLPQDEAPEKTEGREGFYHLINCEGNVTEFKLKYIIRDHDKDSFDRRQKKCLECAAELNRKYGTGTVECELHEQYRNMEEIIRGKYDFLVEYASAAVRSENLEPLTPPIRGGTDGAILTFMGLPCPNLGTGHYNIHGVHEYAVIEEMESSVRILLYIIRLFCSEEILRKLPGA